jgi:hypothetical protein
MPRTYTCGFLVATLSLSTFLVPGCARGPSRQPTDRAEHLVEKALDAWSRGVSPDQFASSSESLQVTDPDWSAGSRLLSFLSVESKQNDGTIRCRVALSLQDRQGKKVDREVVYDVQLGDRTIIRRVSP